LGRTLGQPGDAAGQLSVLRSTLAALESIHTPGGMTALPFEWREDEHAASQAQERIEEPPIVKHILRHPWQLPRLLRRDVPEA
jgi:hypothetical protein